MEWNEALRTFPKFAEYINSKPIALRTHTRDQWGQPGAMGLVHLRRREQELFPPLFVSHVVRDATYVARDPTHVVRDPTHF
eukprot:gene38044-61809_t